MSIFLRFLLLTLPLHKRIQRGNGDSKVLHRCGPTGGGIAKAFVLAGQTDTGQHECAAHPDGSCEDGATQQGQMRVRLLTACHISVPTKANQMNLEDRILECVRRQEQLLHLKHFDCVPLADPPLLL